MAQLTAKQQRFVSEYLKDCNATQAALRAGYSEKSAYSIGQRLLKKVEVKLAVEEEMERLRTENTADSQEVVEYLTSVMRGGPHLRGGGGAEADREACGRQGPDQGGGAAGQAVWPADRTNRAERDFSGADCGRPGK